MNVLTVNLILSTLVFWVAARLYLLPRLQELSPRTVLLPILLLHSLRHLGLMFLAPGAIYTGMPSQFAQPAAYGDLLAALLALIAIPLVAQESRAARAMVWIFSIEGTVDLALAITLATVYGAAPFMGAAYWIPAFWVPALLVTHYIAFVVLLTQPGRKRAEASVPPRAVSRRAIRKCAHRDRPRHEQCAPSAQRAEDRVGYRKRVRWRKSTSAGIVSFGCSAIRVR